MVPSAPQKVEEELLAEELEGEEEKEGPLAHLLPRPPPEVQFSPLLKACPAPIKKIKMRQPWASQREEQPPPQVVEHPMLRPYTQDELVNLSAQYWQKPKEPLRTWLLHLWDIGVKLTIHWPPVNAQHVLAPEDTGAECSLSYDNPEHFPGPLL